MTRRPSRWMRRTPLLACLLGAVALGGGYLAIGAAGDEKTSGLTGKRAEERTQAQLPPLPKKLRARVVQPKAGAAGTPVAEPETDSGLDDPGPRPTRAAGTGGR